MIRNLKSLIKICSFTSNDFWIIFIYSLVIGLLTVIIPITAQGLVNVVTFGGVLQPLFMLSLILFLILIFSSALQILHYSFVENIQQRLFNYITLDLAIKLPHGDAGQIQERGNEKLGNRFFETVTLQKSISSILLSGISIFIQSVFGLIILGLYHPILLVFDIIFISLSFFIIYFPFKKALVFSLEESNSKYEVAFWLEQILKFPHFFKFMNFDNFVFKKIDRALFSYLISRKKHFKKLLSHMIGCHIVQIFSVTSLFIIGGLLVIKNQMTLGQLVAAEIIVTALGYSLIRLTKYLEDVYDLITGSEKISELLSIGLEKNVTSKFTQRIDEISSFNIKISNLKLEIDNSIKTINFFIKNKSKTAIYGDSNSGKTFLIRCILGLHSENYNNVSINDVFICDYELKILRKYSFLIDEKQFLDLSSKENLLLNNKAKSISLVEQVSNELNLSRINDNKFLSETDQAKIIIARAILLKPKLLVIDNFIDKFSFKDVSLFINTIDKFMADTTVIVTTRRQDIAQLFKNRVDL